MSRLQEILAERLAREAAAEDEAAQAESVRINPKRVELQARLNALIALLEELEAPDAKSYAVPSRAPRYGWPIYTRQYYLNNRPHSDAYRLYADSSDGTIGKGLSDEPIADMSEEVIAGCLDGVNQLIAMLSVKHKDIKR